MKYKLDHLTQSEGQRDAGKAIQDDEALFLYAIVRGLRIKTILEFGGLHGYSAKNFIEAAGPGGILFTCDLEPVDKMGENHICIQKDAALITPQDVDNKLLELIFFDCHSFAAQMAAFHALRSAGLIADRTILALHDTNTAPTKLRDRYYELPGGGFIHEPAERRMVNEFVKMGYHAFMFHTDPSKHSPDFPMRKGITVLNLFKELET